LIEIECSSCGEQRNELRARQSRLMPSVRLFLCSGCYDKMEPRYIIIIVGRSDAKKVTEYINGRRYVGEEILAKELM
jgi:hypothetical protein